MPKHITESTGASIAAEYQFTTGKVLIDNTAQIQTSFIHERTSGTGVTIDGVWLKDGSIPVATGGTGAQTAASARTNLGAAASGANSDITSLSALSTPLLVIQGGTGVTTFGTGTSGYILTANSSGSPVYNENPEYIGVICYAPSTSLVAASNVAQINMPFGGYVSQAFAGVSTAATGSSVTVDAQIGASTIFSTKIGIDSGETKSSTAVVPCVIATASSAFNQWDVMSIHVDDPGKTTVATGLVITFKCMKV
jgi:hypothetical protein